MDEPICTNCNKVMLDPMRKTERSDNVEPNCAAFTTDTLKTEPALCIPKTEAHEDMRDMTRSDNDDPKLTKSSVEICEPTSIRRRRESAEPQLEKESTESALCNMERALDWTDSPDPIRQIARRDRVDPKLVKDSTDNFAPVDRERMDKDDPK
jgi:hypothetical protein